MNNLDSNKINLFEMLLLRTMTADTVKQVSDVLNIVWEGTSTQWDRNRSSWKKDSVFNDVFHALVEDRLEAYLLEKVKGKITGENKAILAEKLAAIKATKDYLFAVFYKLQRVYPNMKLEQMLDKKTFPKIYAAMWWAAEHFKEVQTRHQSQNHTVRQSDVLAQARENQQLGDVTPSVEFNELMNLLWEVQDTGDASADIQVMKNSLSSDYFVWYHEAQRRYNALMSSLIDSNGRLVITPYVEELISNVLWVWNSPTNRPIFFHGPLWTWKTEMLEYTAKKFLTERWLTDEEAKKNIYVLSWNKEFDAKENITWGFEIEWMSLDETALNKAYKDALQFAESQKNSDGSSAFDSEELKKLSFTALTQQNLKTKAYLWKFYRAMRDGAVVILDEINAIPHEILIMLNYLLTQQPGKFIVPPINELEGFYIHPNFRVAATWNIPKEWDVAYAGRQKMDAAFLSRWDKSFAIGYLPQTDRRSAIVPSNVKAEAVKAGLNTLDEIFDYYLKSLSEDDKKAVLAKISQERYKGDDLFLALAIIWLRGQRQKLFPVDYFDQIYILAQGAKSLMNMFEWKTNSSQNAWAKSAAMFKQNEASMRSLSTIVNSWAAGWFRMTLDTYVYYNIVQQALDDELRLTYYTALESAWFFKKSEQWPDVNDRQAILDLNIRLHQKSSIHRLTHEDKSAHAIQTQNTAGLKYYWRPEIYEHLFGASPDLPTEIYDIAPAPVETVEEEVIPEGMAAAISAERDMAEFDAKFLDKIGGDHWGEIKSLIENAPVFTLPDPSAPNFQEEYEKLGKQIEDLKPTVDHIFSIMSLRDYVNLAQHLGIKLDFGHDCVEQIERDFNTNRHTWREWASVQ